MKTNPPQEKTVEYWSLISVLTLAMISIGAMELLFGIFLKPIQDEFGWSRTAISATVSIAEITGGLCGIFMGRLADRKRPLVLTAFCFFIGGTAFLLMSQTHHIWQLYLFFGFLAGLGMTGYLPLIGAVSRRFISKRVLSIGVVMSGITLAQMVLPPLLAIAIAGYGWRFASIAMAVFVWLSVIPALVLFYRDKRTPVPDTAEAKPLKEPGTAGKREYKTHDALKTVQLWMLVVIEFVFALGTLTVAIHIIAYAIDRGISPTLAALVLTSVSIGNLAGKFSISLVSKIAGNRPALMLMIILVAAGFFLLMTGPAFPVICVLGLIMGFGLGGSVPIRMTMIPEIFGLKSISGIMGITGLAWAIGALTGPVLAGYAFDVSGSYNIAFLTGGLIMLAGIGAACVLKVPGVKKAIP